MLNITDILVQYPILCSVIQNLTTRDLLHLASASKLAAEICHLRHVTFDDLKRYTVCDGSGARAKWIWDAWLKCTCEYDDRTLLPTLAMIVRAKMNHHNCIRIFSGDLFRSSQGRCEQLDPRPCLKCKIMVCEVIGHLFCQHNPVSELTVAERLVVRSTVLSRINPALLRRKVSKNIENVPIFGDFDASVGSA